MSIEESVLGRVEDARRNAGSSTFSDQMEAHESDAVAKFINGTYDIEKLKELWDNSPEPAGRVTFETLPEFIIAVRNVVKGKEQQDEILDHENAHAIEALQRGYSLKYALEFTRDVRKFLILKIIRQSLDSAGVVVDLFNKDGAQPKDHVLREDLIAILSAPENMTDGEMSSADRSMLAGT